MTVLKNQVLTSLHDYSINLYFVLLLKFATLHNNFYLNRCNLIGRFRSPLFVTVISHSVKFYRNSSKSRIPFIVRSSSMPLSMSSTNHRRWNEQKEICEENERMKFVTPEGKARRNRDAIPF